jgi:hypothetical protein
MLYYKQALITVLNFYFIQFNPTEMSQLLLTLVHQSFPSFLNIIMKNKKIFQNTIHGDKN